MRVRVLGCSGGSAPGREPSCYLLDGGLAVDAGSLSTRLTVEEQNRLSDVFLTHAHWDHCRDLPFHVINRGMELKPLVVHGLPVTVEAVRAHLMNDAVWFRAFDLPSAETPMVVAAPLQPGETVECGRYRVTAFAVPHTIPAVSYVIDDGRCAIVINADTGGGGVFRDMPRPESPIRAVFLEASFPNSMADFAEMTGHLTPEKLAAEVADFPDDVQVIVTHVKPAHEELVAAEVARLPRPNVRLCRDGDVFEF
jgi:ribonuclease BN (tRNA processing enzyme)